MLKDLGYSEEKKGQLNFPGFPESIEDNRNHIADLTAEIILANAEFNQYKNGEHPHAEIIEQFIEKCTRYT